MTFDIISLKVHGAGNLELYRLVASSLSSSGFVLTDQRDDSHQR